MIGLAYYRIQRDLSRREFAKQVGTTEGSVRTYEERLAPQGRGCSSLWLTFSDYFGVSVEELLKSDYPDIPDRNNQMLYRKSRTANPSNPVTVYYRTHRLSYRELAELLGKTSRECGRKACAAQQASRKHIRTLAKYEGISEEEFIRKYSNEKEGK